MDDLRCPDCGIAYVKESVEDRRIHRTYHDEALNGIPGAPLRSERTIWRQRDERIFLVTPASPKPERVRARKVAGLANREMHHDFGIYNEHEPPDKRDLHLFLNGVRDRLVGLAIFERRDHVCRVTWEEYDRREPKELAPASPVWSFGFAWVHRKYRRQGIAHRLFHEGLVFLKVTPEDMGVYTPFSEEGEKLARSLFPTGFLVAK